MRFLRLVFAAGLLAAFSDLVVAKPSYSPDKGAEELCKDKAEKAVEALGQINTPGAVKAGTVFLGVKKAKVPARKVIRETANFEVTMSQDDKTKTYTVIAEFSKDNKWCQVIDVQLTGLPQ